MSKFTVVGGAYREVCLHPWWDQLFGSGVRAASALSDLAEKDELELYTWIPEREERTLSNIANTFGFALRSNRRRDDIEFQYTYPAASPQLYPDQFNIQREELVNIQISNGLVFGLVEAEPAITASRLTWDPQSGYLTRAKRRDSLDAKELALVANMSELLALGKDIGIEFKEQLGLEGYAQKVRNGLDVDVIVVKQGVRGALVLDGKSSKTIPSYQTPYVFPIGSGDVFSAVFAWEWANNRKSPYDAAINASKAASIYCGSQVLPIEAREMSADRDGSLINTTKKNSIQIYLAGPLFTVSQNWLLAETHHHFESMGLNVFSPKDELGTVINEADMQRVAEGDIAGLENSDLVFAILSGMDPGTLVEIGYAHALGKPIIVFAENIKPSDLTMVKGLGAKCFDDFSTAIYHAGWQAFKCA